MVTSSVRLVRPLGQGGMGSVWVAEHLGLHTQVVVKFISAELAGSDEAQERFRREAAAAAQVKSPHVVQTFDHGLTAWGAPYIVMEMLEGRDLGDYLAEHGALTPKLVRSIVGQLGRALERAHERGIVHRDLKPGNVFLTDGGGGEPFVKLLDFGIAKGVDVPRVDSQTKTGTMMGSPFYMSPEQIVGSRDVDHRTDLWALGVVAYEALTGARPFDAETLGGLAVKIHSEPLPKPSAKRPELSPSVDTWFERACARAPADRYANAREMADALGVALEGGLPSVPKLGSFAPGAHGELVSAPTMPALATTQGGGVTTGARTTPSAGRRSAKGWLVAGVAVVAGLAVAAGLVAREGRAVDAPASSVATGLVAPQPSVAPPPPTAPAGSTASTPLPDPLPSESAPAASASAAAAASPPGTRRPPRGASTGGSKPATVASAPPSPLAAPPAAPSAPPAPPPSASPPAGHDIY